MKEQEFRNKRRALSAASFDTVAGVLDAPAEGVLGLPAEVRPEVEAAPRSVRSATRRQRGLAPAPVRHFAVSPVDEGHANRQAEQFYLQKQIQVRTQMVFILEDGSRVQGVIEWYDRHCIKVRGKTRVLIYKSAIKYLYKAGEVGSAPSD